MTDDPRSVAGRLPIEPRNQVFDLSPDLPAAWHGGNPWISHFFDGLSVMFPEGERFFMDSVRRFQDRIADPRLREDVRGFLGQEGVHAREHRRYNEVLAARGYPVEAMERYVRRMMSIDRALPARHQLALTCALEHFTAIFADVLLRDPRMLRDAHPVYARLWRWHAVEETEHKSVAFDVYRVVAPGFGGYLARIAVMAIATALFALDIAFFQLRLVLHDRRRGVRGGGGEARRFFWKEPGFLRRGLRHYASYYRRGFHPWQIDNADLVERWKAEYAR